MSLFFWVLGNSGLFGDVNMLLLLLLLLLLLRHSMIPRVVLKMYEILQRFISIEDRLPIMKEFPRHLPRTYYEPPYSQKPKQNK